MDTVDKATRSRIMASVRQRDTGPEIKLRRALHRLGFRYRLHCKTLPGSPDIVFPKYKAVIFVHGCFWHSHGCKYSTKPTTRQTFWQNKFAANKERDQRKIQELREAGWRVLVVWECAIKTNDAVLFRKSQKAVAKWLKSKNVYREVVKE